MSAAGFERVVVAVDGSDSASAALDRAIDLARRYDAELLIVSVAPLAAVVAPSNLLGVPVPVAPDARPPFRALVEAAVARAQADGLDHVTGICEEGAAVEEILAHLGGGRDELLVVGSRGLSATQRLVLGSVSTALVTKAPCPVLVVRARTPGSAGKAT